MSPSLAKLNKIKCTSYVLFLIFGFRCFQVTREDHTMGHRGIVWNYYLFLFNDPWKKLDPEDYGKYDIFKVKKIREALSTVHRITQKLLLNDFFIIEWFLVIVGGWSLKVVGVLHHGLFQFWVCLSVSFWGKIFNYLMNSAWGLKIWCIQ